ncbi:MAG TPA: bifunctional helix-turn-helix transcriptional regulator/GNAT family N-acetyltransferase [Gemmatimonadales bacterium]|nr:bifunctional helix-turn-helix transcriptional regulator/GNAT family N-acetyltransferase [Gemmatimonadales bacterium]
MDEIGQIRSFNRTVTQHIGALVTGFLGRDRPLGASRLLFEIGPDGIEVRRLRDRLELDSGYASRLLRALEAEGLVRTGPGADDARVRVASLTAAGRRELALLNRRSDESAAALLERLTPEQRAALTAAMGTVERLLLAGAVGLEVVDPAGRAARYCVQQYFQELAHRFEGGFDPARSISAGDDELRPPRGYFVLATLHGDAVGCGALKCHPDFGELKRMWVAPEARGLGLGRRILGGLEELARNRRLPLLRLETNQSLVEAQRLYRTSGYREVAAFNDEAYAHHWFEKRLAPASASSRARGPVQPRRRP